MMMHVEQIQDLVDSGKVEEASEKIEQLLSLGPKNTSALKLKADILESQGRFDEELEVWAKIIEIDPEDAEASIYFQMRHLEEREHFYFTDHLPGGGQRYLAYPRSLLKAFLIGLTGSGIFLIASNLGQTHFPLLISAPSILGLFTLCVLGPWAYIIYTYLKMMRFVVLSENGIQVSSRLNSASFKWDEIKSIHLAYSDNVDSGELKLVVEPIDSASPLVEIDLGRDTSVIRARSFFLRDLSTRYMKPEHAPLDKIDRSDRAVLSF